MKDYILPFTFEDLSIRGKLIRLDNSYNDIIKSKNYPSQVNKLLAELLIIAVYLGSSLKTEGSVAIQLQTQGFLKLLFVECRSNLNIRGIAKFSSQIEGMGKGEEIFTCGDLRTAKLAITITSDKTNYTYQSLVPVNSIELSEVFRSFISQSEQIETALEIKYETNSITGLFLQILPESDHNALIDREPLALKALISDSKNWNFNTTDIAEMSGFDILMSIFPLQELRVYEPCYIQMKCSCNRKKIEELISVLGRQDAEKLLVEQGSIKVTCEMCGETQEFDKLDFSY